MNSGDNTQSSGESSEVVVEIYPSQSDAELARASLEAHGIPSRLQADDCGGMYPFFDTTHGVKVLVRGADAEAARALLSENAIATEPRRPAIPNKPAPRIKLSLPQIACGAVAGALLCLLYQHTQQLGTHRYSYDHDGDSVPDEFLVYKDGYCAEQSFDRNSDRKKDSWIYYDSQGRITEQINDDNFDGRIDGTWRYTNGVVVEAKLDTDFNGVTDVTYYFRHGLTSEAVWRPNGSTITSLHQSFRHGQLVEEWCDTDMNGSFDVTNRFDAFQRRIEQNSIELISTKNR